MGNRRGLLSAVVAAAGALLAGFAGVLGRARRERAGRLRVVLARPAADGVSFDQGVVLVRDGPSLRAFSARCPHLGCRLSRVDAGALVCPCHGSRFDTAGHRLEGPAAADLQPLPIVERVEGRLEVDLPA